MILPSAHKRRSLLAAVFCLALAASAHAQSPAGGGSSAAADMDIRLSQMQDQIRTLTGEIESQQHDIAELKAQTDKVNADTQLRLSDLEAKAPGAAATAAATPAAPASEAPTALTPSTQSTPMYGGGTPKPEGAKPEGNGTLGTLQAGPTAGATPEQAYETAYNALGQNDYAGAETGFKTFLAHYPKHALAANASYWLADTYFRRNMFDQAVTAFADSYKNYPNGAKAPDSLLDLGLTLGQQGKTQEACLTFSEVLKQFPAATQKIKNAVTQERAHYKCS